MYCTLLQLPSEEEILLQKLREDARAAFLQRKSRELLDNDELQVTKIQLQNDKLHGLLWILLVINPFPPRGSPLTSKIIWH